MFPSSINSFHLALYAVVALILTRLLNKRKANPLPPGPPKLPVIGNLLDMPSSHEWETFAAWGKKYGDIVSISICGQPLVVLNSFAAAQEMLAKSGKVYNDRPVMQMGGELVGWNRSLVLIRYGDNLRAARKYFHHALGTAVTASKFFAIQERQSEALLGELIRRPSEAPALVRKMVGAIILKIAYGYQVEKEDDPYIIRADMATASFAQSTAPGRFLVNLIPALRRVPAWVPGASFHKTAAKWRELCDATANEPFFYVKEQMAAGTAEPSFTSGLLEEPGVTEDQESDIKWAATSLYLAGSESSVATLNAFLLAMALNPDVMRKAQQEIDSVVDKTRLPDFTDREKLPYVHAVLKEVIRWHVVSPTGFPHHSLEDSIHKGYHIPKDTIIIFNIWWMAKNPEVYPDPEEFKPERYLGPNPQQDPRDYAFGFGRRICPGQILAEDTIYIAIVRILAAFDIHPPMKDGVPLKPVYEQLPGTVSLPKAFECLVSPRSADAIRLIDY